MNLSKSFLYRCYLTFFLSIFVFCGLPAQAKAQSNAESKIFLENIHQQYANILALSDLQQKEKIKVLEAQLTQYMEHEAAPSAYLFYNLGTMYLKTEDYGHAIYNFKKAYLLNPNDQRIVDHLHRALLQAKVSAESKDDLSLMLWAQKFWSSISVLDLQVALMSLSVFFGVYFMVRGQRSPRSFWVMVLAMALLSSLCIMRSENVGIAKEVVLLKEQNPRTGLGLQYPGLLADNAELPSGSSGKLIREDSGWYEVLWGDKGRGWVPKSVAGVVY